MRQQITNKSETGFRPLAGINCNPSRPVQQPTFAFPSPRGDKLQYRDHLLTPAQKIVSVPSRG